MEDLHKAGGVPALLRELRPRLHLDALTASGLTLGEEIAASGAGFAQAVIRTAANPVFHEGGIAVLRGNLAPRGALIKQSDRRPAPHGTRGPGRGIRGPRGSGGADR